MYGSHLIIFYPSVNTVLEEQTAESVLQRETAVSFNHSPVACVQEKDKEEYERPGFSSFDFWLLSQSEHMTATNKVLYEELKGLLYRIRIGKEMTCDPRVQFIS